MFARQVIVLWLVMLPGCKTTSLADDACAVPLPAGTEFVAAVEPEGTPLATALAGTVREIHLPARPAPEGIGIDAWTRVTIEGDRPGSFRVLLPPQVRFPLLLGDHIQASFACASPPGSVLCTATVSAADGTLLLYATHVGGPPPDGWALSRGPKCGARTGTEISFCTGLDHAGRHTMIAPNTWRRLVATDGRWLVSALTTELAGSSPPPPDWQPTKSYSIVRVR